MSAHDGPRRTLGLLSVVTPMHDEQDNVRPLYDRLSAALDGLTWELVVTDDGSQRRARPRSWPSSPPPTSA